MASHLDELEQAWRNAPRDEPAPAARYRAALDEAHRAAPEDLGLRLRLGAFLARTGGDLALARTHLEAARSDLALILEAAYHLAHCLVRERAFPAAVHELKAVQQVAPVGSGLWRDATCFLGRLYEQARKTEQATREYERIVRWQRGGDDGEAGQPAALR